MLRRYASGFTGSTAIGDRLIEECLCAYCDGEHDVDLTHLHVGLFRLFHDHLANRDFRERFLRGLPFRPMDLNAALLTLPRDERAAVLLTRTLGFTYAEAGAITRTREGDVRVRVLSGARKLLGLTTQSATAATRTTARRRPVSAFESRPPSWRH